jgi:hypothetical protein
MQQQTTHTPSSPKKVTVRSRNEIGRVFQRVFHYSTLGRGPEMKHERDSQMRVLTKLTGRGPDEIDKIAEMIRDGAQTGARTKVDGWFTVAPA